jgi:hypothetical protein
MAYVGNPGSNKLVLFESIFRRILQEAAVQPSAAAQQGIALYKFESGAMTTYVLYKTRGGLFEELLEYSKYMRLGEKSGGEIYLPAITRAVVGAMQLYFPGDEPPFVSGVKAEQGYGPLLYDIALSDNKELAQSHESVSAEAQSVWSFYKKKRKKDTVYQDPSEAFDRPRVGLKDRYAKRAEVKQLKDVHDAFDRRVENHKRRELEQRGAAAVVINWEAFIAGLEDTARHTVSTLHM